MARRCDLCGKKAVAGHNVSYSKRRTARRFLPNLRFMTLNGQRIKTCMKCLKKMKNENKVVSSKYKILSKEQKTTEIKNPEVIKETIKIRKPVRKLKLG